MAEIPVIDISPFLDLDGDKSKRNNVIEEWNDAFKAVGFAIITGHGVPDNVIVDAYDNLVRFFKQEYETKMKYCLNKGYGDGGFVPVGHEAVAKTLLLNNDTKGVAIENSQVGVDLVESLEFNARPGSGCYGDVIPEKPECLKELLQAYWDHVHNLCSKLMELSAVALGLEAGYFSQFYTNPYECLKLAFYPAQDNMKPKSGQLRYGPHTDYVGLTILWQDDSPGGLEVAGPDGQWIPVKPVKHSFVINSGDLIQRWTNDYWKSNIHRVVNPPEGEASRHRLSLVFFTGPNRDAVVEPLSVCCSESNPAKYPPITAGEHNQMKVSVEKM